ncbi:trypsin-like peptidase domain-containing protein [Microbacteriaceae bacterium 4G12]
MTDSHRDPEEIRQVPGSGAAADDARTASNFHPEGGEHRADTSATQPIPPTDSAPTEDFGVAPRAPEGSSPAADAGNAGQTAPYPAFQRPQAPQQQNAPYGQQADAPYGQQPSAPQYGAQQPHGPQYGAPQYGAQGYGAAPHTSAPYTGENPAGSAQPTGAAGKTTTKRRTAPLLLAGVAVGALIGGVAGGGMAAVLTNDDTPATTSSTSESPTNVIVNDPNDATVVTEVAQKASPSVVTISVAGAQGGGTGSGVILSADGFILTNTHVVTLDGATGSPEIQVTTTDGRNFSADLVGTDPIADLAVIKLRDASGLPTIEFADSDSLNVGEMTVAIGAPLGLSNTVTNGIVSALNRSIQVASAAAPEDDSSSGDSGGQTPFDFWEFGDQAPSQEQSTQSAAISLAVIQTDAAINPGNSGGALLDSDGKLIGINVAIASAGGSSSTSASGNIGVGFAIPSNFAKRIADEIIEDGQASHGLLGASVSDADADGNVLPVSGAYIVRTTNGGAAANAGLEAGDIVTGINGVGVASSTDLTAQVRVLQGGAETEVTYVRDGEENTVDVTLGTL